MSHHVLEAQTHISSNSMFQVHEVSQEQNKDSHNLRKFSDALVEMPGREVTAKWRSVGIRCHLKTCLVLGLVEANCLIS